ncbi:MAG: hypothetical protein HYR72_02985 [Deltaproteobacteria bacterium]|nr:hypothetical protein [Deltaproteobacteria bacterium]MBI3388376.1 hypothetical protein [Deltaproteobacteria bacterium]
MVAVNNVRIVLVAGALILAALLASTPRSVAQQFTCDIDELSTNGPATQCSGTCPIGQTCQSVESPCPLLESGTAGAAGCAAEIRFTCACLVDPGIVNSLLRHQR